MKTLMRLAVAALATASAHAAATTRLPTTAAAALASALAAAATTALSAATTTAALTAAALAGTTLSATAALAAATLAAAALAGTTLSATATTALAAATLAAAATAALTAAATAALAAAILILSTHAARAQALVPDVLIIEVTLRSRGAVAATGAPRAPCRAAEALASRAGAARAGAILLPTGAATRSTERPALRTSWGPAHSSLSALRAEILILVLVTIRHGRVLRTESGADVSRRRRAALGSAQRGNACAMSRHVRVNCNAHRG